jgi:peptide deformylase
MALLKIITLPDPRLRMKSEKVTSFDDSLKTLAADLIETMNWAKGIGLAAVQVGVHKRIIVIDIGDLNENEKYIEGDEESETRLSERKSVSNPEIFVNPEIIQSNGEIVYEEGCLSVPGVYAEVKRKESLKIRYQNLNGKSFEVETHGLRSIVLQHEMDHMEGIVFPDRLGTMQRMMVLKKYTKLQKEKSLVEEE